MIQQRLRNSETLFRDLVSRGTCEEKKKGEREERREKINKEVKRRKGEVRETESN